MARLVLVIISFWGLCTACSPSEQLSSPEIDQDKPLQIAQFDSIGGSMGPKMKLTPTQLSALVLDHMKETLKLKAKHALKMADFQNISIDTAVGGVWVLNGHAILPKSYVLKGAPDSLNQIIYAIVLDRDGDGGLYYNPFVSCTHFCINQNMADCRLYIDPEDSCVGSCVCQHCHGGPNNGACTHFMIQNNYQPN